MLESNIFDITQVEDATSNNIRIDTSAETVLKFIDSQASLSETKILGLSPRTLKISLKELTLDGDISILNSNFTCSVIFRVYYGLDDYREFNVNTNCPNQLVQNESQYEYHLKLKDIYDLPALSGSALEKVQLNFLNGGHPGYILINCIYNGTVAAKILEIREGREEDALHISEYLDIFEAWINGSGMSFSKDGFILSDASLLIRNSNGDLVFYADTDGNLTLAGTIYATAGEFSGSLKAATGDFIGSISAADGDIGGFIINNNSIESKNGKIKLYSSLDLEEDFKKNKKNYYYINDGKYILCTDEDTYDSQILYYYKKIDRFYGDVNSWEELDKTEYYYFSNNEYIQCKEEDEYNENRQYYIEGSSEYTPISIINANIYDANIDKIYYKLNNEYIPCVGLYDETKEYYNKIDDNNYERLYIFDVNKTNYYYLSNNEYIQCKNDEPYDENKIYYHIYYKEIKPNESLIEVENIHIGTGAQINEYLQLGNLKLWNPDHDNAENKVIELLNDGENYFTLTNEGYIEGNNWSIKKEAGHPYVTARFGRLIAEDGEFNGTIYATDGIFSGSIVASVINATTLVATNFVTEKIRSMGGSFIFKPSFEIVEIKETETVNNIEIKLKPQSENNEIKNYFTFLTDFNDIEFELGSIDSRSINLYQKFDNFANFDIGEKFYTNKNDNLTSTLETTTINNVTKTVLTLSAEDYDKKYIILGLASGNYIGLVNLCSGARYMASFKVKNTNNGTVKMNILGRKYHGSDWKDKTTYPEDYNYKSYGSILTDEEGVYTLIFDCEEEFSIVVFRFLLLTGSVSIYDCLIELIDNDREYYSGWTAYGSVNFGNLSNNEKVRTKELILVTPNTSYNIIRNFNNVTFDSDGALIIYFYDIYLQPLCNTANRYASNKAFFTVPANAHYIKISAGRLDSDTFPFRSEDIIKLELENITSKIVALSSSMGIRYGTFINFDDEDTIIVNLATNDYQNIISNKNEYFSLTLIGESNAELLIGINSDKYLAGNILPSKSLVMETIGLLSINSGISILNNNINLLLGDLSNLKNIHSSLKYVGGYGLYADNVVLHGSLMTLTGDKSYAGVNTQKNIKFDPSVWGHDTEDFYDENIIFWGGANSLAEEDILVSPFIVTDKGSIFASRGIFKGAVLSDSLITDTVIKTPTIYGTGKEPSLKIYNIGMTSPGEYGLYKEDGYGGIGFYKLRGRVDSTDNTVDYLLLNLNENSFIYYVNGANTNKREFITFNNGDIKFNGTEFKSGNTILKDGLLYQKYENGNYKAEIILQAENSGANGEVQIGYLDYNMSGSTISITKDKILNTSENIIFSNADNSTKILKYTVNNNGYYCLYVE